MSKLILLGAGKSYDTNKQVVEKNQIIQMNGYEGDRYVVYDIKFGIGYYFDDENPTFKTEEELAVLLQTANELAKQKQEAQQREAERKEQLKAIGRERLKGLLPKEAQAIIIAEERQNESEPMMDYYGHSTTRTVILGFSTHKRDLFSEMRKYAGNFEGTAYLAEYNKDYENREKYSMGEGYYLGAHKYSGWIIQKEQFYGSQEQIIERYALTAGDENNIRVSATSAAEKAVTETVTGNFIIVDYSEKALAVFGDTKTIKEDLKSLGGRFNPSLTHESEKRAGWIFSKSKRAGIEKLLKH